MAQTEKLINEIKEMLPLVNLAYVEHIHRLLSELTKDKRK